MIKKNRLNIIFLLTVVIIILNFYYFVTERSLNQYADWLINYQGGFVRRGLIGEIFYQIHSLLTIRLDVLVFFSVSLLYIFFYKNLLKIIKNVNLNLLNLLIIFSPISFIYPVMEEKASGRKDILFLFFLSITALYLKKLSFFKQKYLLILISGILIFSHTGFLFLIPALFLIYIFLNKDKKINILFKELFIVLLTISLFLLFILNNKTIDMNGINLICNSLGEYVRTDCSKTGYVSTLNWSIQKNLELKRTLWMTKNYNLFYFCAFIISYMPILYALYNSKFIKYKKKNVLLFFSLFLFGSLPLYYIGVDYGRYMHLTYLSLIILYFIAVQEKIIICHSPKVKTIKKANINFATILLFLFLYGFTFTIPHCCSSKFKFNYSNFITKINKSD
tara:strand:+ start:97 stop:1272 length:1176 start_codon:yes stop_codon:yes gene_type:complete